MTFSLSQVGVIARRLLSYAEEQGIRTSDDVVRATPSFVRRGADALEFSLRPSEGGSRAYTLSYISPGKGIPLEVRMNRTLGYSQVIMKADQVVEGYTPFSSDGRGAIHQARVFDSSEWNVVRDELERLETFQ